MNKREKLNNSIKNLNLAWRLIRRALRIIEEEFKTNSNTDVDYFIWKLTKCNDKLQSFIYKKIENTFVEENFQNLIKRLRKPEDKEE